MWDLPGPGHKPVSPEFIGGFSTTAPPGKSGFLLISNLLMNQNLSIIIKSKWDEERKQRG